MEEKTTALYEKLTRTLIEKKLTVSTMESCTSGCIASLITDTEGASAVMRGGFVTYCNEAKIRCGVPAETIEKYGVYSEETAAAMAVAVKNFYETDIAIGVTGSLGRADPANEDSFPGKVYYAIAIGDSLYRCSLDGISGRNRHESKLMIAEHVGWALLKGISARAKECIFQKK